MFMKKDENYRWFALGALMNLIVGAIFAFLSFGAGFVATFAVATILFIVLLWILRLLHSRQKLNMTSATLVAVVYFGLVLVSYFVESQIVQYKTVPIVQNPIHLGDKELQWMYPAKPDTTNFFRKDFELPIAPSKARLRIEAKDIDSDYRNGPAVSRQNSIRA